MKKNCKYIVGIDGCKFGWVAVAINELGEFEISKHSNFTELISHYPAAEKYLVDMVIGLGNEKCPRTLEKFAREKLRPHRTSSVFTPPCRAAVYEKSYEAAKQKNIILTGKSISIQAWNIVPKIRELDQFILQNSQLRNSICEAHPEICFAGLNYGQPMKFKKSISAGEEERLNLLHQLFPQSVEIYKKGRQSFLKKNVKNDDLIDALGLAVTAWWGTKNGFDYIRDERNTPDHFLIYCVLKS